MNKDQAFERYCKTKLIRKPHAYRFNAFSAAWDIQQVKIDKLKEALKYVLEKVQDRSPLVGAVNHYSTLHNRTAPTVMLIKMKERMEEALSSVEE